MPETVDDLAGAPFPGLFVLSLPRTGSTLLRLLLDSHPAIYCPDELNLGRLLHALHLTEEGLAEAGGAGAQATDEIDSAGPAAAAARRAVAERMATAARAKGKRLWCDKSPANLELLPVIDRILPQARYLVLHRHALDFALSCLRFSTYGFFLTVVEEYVRRDHRNFLRALLRAWNEKTRELLDFERRHPDRCCRLLYEDLAAAPESALGRVADFLGVERVPDLAARSFAVAHHQRAFHGDAKALFSRGVSDVSIGSGAEINPGALRRVPAEIRERTNEILVELGYPAFELTAGGLDLHLARRAAAGGAPQSKLAAGDFFTALDRRLRERPVPPSVSGAFTFVLTGPAGGTWTVDLSQTPPRVAPGTDSARAVLTLAAGDFLAIAAGAMNPALAFEQGKLRLEGETDPSLLSDLLTILLSP